MAQMFKRNDIPDFMTEAAYTRDRHGPPSLSAEERAKAEAQQRELESKIISAYERGSTIRSIAVSFARFGLHRIRRVIATKNRRDKFPDKAARSQFFTNLQVRMCKDCLAQYLSGPWNNWERGKRLTFPEPPICQHPPMSEGAVPKTP